MMVEPSKRRTALVLVLQVAMFISTGIVFDLSSQQTLRFQRFDQGLGITIFT